LTVRPAPFAPGSISLGVHAHDLPAPGQVADLLGQAEAAFAAGVDGVTVSEHHAGNAQYLPNPLLTAAWILAAAPAAGWAGACPLLLAARPLAHVVEDLAWLAARHPGRVGVAFVAGYVAADFAAPGHEFETRGQRFHAALPQVVAALAGRPEGPLAAQIKSDRAVAAVAEHPVPVLATAEGVVGARRAAAAGAGVLMGAYRPAAGAAAAFAAYREAGGKGPRVLIRRFHVGRLRPDLRALIDALHRRAGGENAQMVYEGEDPAEVGSQIATDLRDAGASAVNLRVNVETAGPEDTREQLSALPELVARLRSELDVEDQ
jgi:alkanesulfonate monooxygenase SsuD/methylene tetrahydromethanopterin reductase-like flavin-dependent oxidoreductase (luciferase family)